MSVDTRALQVLDPEVRDIVEQQIRGELTQMLRKVNVQYEVYEEEYAGSTRVRANIKLNNVPVGGIELIVPHKILYSGERK